MKKGKSPIKINKPQPSFFMQQRQKNGDGWLNLVSTEFIRKNAMRIFKDLATGAANTEYEYQYFLNKDFVYNLNVAAYDNASYSYACYVGLKTYLESNPADQNMARIMQEHLDRYNLYNSIVMYLNSIYQDVTYQNGTLVKYYLQQMVADIRWKKNAFNGYFITLPKDYDTNYVKKERRFINNDNRMYQDDSGQRGFFAEPI